MSGHEEAPTPSSVPSAADPSVPSDAVSEVSSPAAIATPTRTQAILFFLPLLALGVFIPALYPYIREVLAKIFYGEIWGGDPDGDYTASNVLTTVSFAWVSAAQVAEVISWINKPAPTGTTEVVVNPSWRDKLKVGIPRFIIASLAAMTTGLLTNAQNKEFDFNLSRAMLSVTMGIIITLEFVNGLLGSNPTILMNLRAFMRNRNLTAINTASDAETAPLLANTNIPFSRPKTMAAFIAVYSPLVVFAWYCTVDELNRNLIHSDHSDEAISPGAYVLFALAVLGSLPFAVLDLDRGVKLIEELLQGRINLRTVISALACIVVGAAASTVEAVRGFELHEVGKTNVALGRLFTLIVEVEKTFPNISFAHQLGVTLTETPKYVKALCAPSPRLSGPA